MSKNILIICETGISASLLVSKLLEAIREKELSYDLDYAPVCRIEEKLGYKEYDVLMLTPQVARVKEKSGKIFRRLSGAGCFYRSRRFSLYEHREDTRKYRKVSFREWDIS